VAARRHHRSPFRQQAAAHGSCLLSALCQTLVGQEVETGMTGPEIVRPGWRNVERPCRPALFVNPPFAFNVVPTSIPAKPEFVINPATV